MNDNLVVCRGNQKFIRDPKTHKKQLKMTKDKKSHKKLLKEKVAKRVKETTEKNTKLEEQNKPKFRVPESKPNKIPLTQTKKLRKINSNENLLACLEDMEYAEEDAYLDMHDIEWHNEVSNEAYLKEVEEEEYQEYLREKEELECNDNLSRMERIQKKNWCEKYENRMAPKKETCRTLEEYEIERKQEQLHWTYYKRYGLSRKMFNETLEYERNIKALENEDLDADDIEELIIKIWTYEENLNKWEMNERIKMENWFCNFAENNSKFVQKIQERNYCLAKTVVQAMG
jgi:hypothetical protein